MNPVRLRYKIIAYIGAWILTFIATDPSASLWALAWMFPLGLAAVINRHAANAGGCGISFACIAVYAFPISFYWSKCYQSSCLQSSDTESLGLRIATPPRLKTKGFEFEGRQWLVCYAGVNQKEVMTRT